LQIGTPELEEELTAPLLEEEETAPLEDEEEAPLEDTAQVTLFSWQLPPIQHSSKVPLSTPGVQTKLPEEQRGEAPLQQKLPELEQ
jgi:hypothetical protein